MKNLILTSICFFLFCSSTFSQDFDTAVGVRLGYPTALSAKKFISEYNALEAYVGYRPYVLGSSISFHGAYQIHADIDDVDNLQYYYGGGASLILTNPKFDNANTSVGLSGYLGLSYTLDDAPINFSLDWVPTFIIGGQAGFGTGITPGHFTAAARYILGGSSK